MTATRPHFIHRLPLHRPMNQRGGLKKVPEVPRLDLGLTTHHQARATTVMQIELFTEYFHQECGQMLKQPIHLG